MGGLSCLRWPFLNTTTMKYLQLICLLLSIQVVIAQTDCDIPSRNSVSISYEYVPNLPIGINVRIGSIAQSGNLSASVGFGMHGRNDIFEDKLGVYHKKFAKQLSLSGFVSYKVYHNEGVISLHTMLSGHYYEQDGAIWKGGMRMDIPAGFKAFYIYPSITSKIQPSIEMGVFFDL